MSQYKIGKYNEDGSEEIFDKVSGIEVERQKATTSFESEKRVFLITMATCAFFSSRDICLNDHCEACHFNLNNEPIFPTQGEMLKYASLAVKNTSRVFEVLKSDYEKQKLKQGKLEKIDFPDCKNITDKYPELKSQTIINKGFSKLHLANLMNESTGVYLSQGNGVEFVYLEPLSGKTVEVTGDDVEILIGSAYLMYKTSRRIVGDVFCLDILFVAEKKGWW